MFAIFSATALERRGMRRERREWKGKYSPCGYC